MTGRDLLTAALRTLGVLAQGEAPAAIEATEGLSALNLMIDSWSNESLMIKARVREVFPTVAAQAAYTMGTSANFSTTRPMAIENILVQLTGSSPAVEAPLELLNKDQFAAIATKSLTTSIPQCAYVEGTYPYETINLWPVPLAIMNVVIYSRKALTQIATLDTAISLAPGYEEALKYNLACRLAPEYGKEPPATVAVLASESKAWLKRTNQKASLLRVDTALRPTGRFNMLNGEPR